MLIVLCPLALAYCFDHPARGVGHIARGDHLDSRVLEDLLALVDVGPFHSHDQWHAELDLARGVDDALRQHVAQHDAAEDVDEHRLDPRIGKQDAKRRGDLLRTRATADVEEVRRLGAVVLHDIHRGHREPRAVDHASDVAVLRHDQRINLDQRRVGFVESAIEGAQQRGELVDLLVLKPQRKRNFARLETAEPNHWIDQLGHYLVGRLGGDLFDLHTAFGARDNRDAFGVAIDEHPEVKLARDIARLFDVNASHDPPLRTGLMRYERLAEQLRREVARLGRTRYQLDAAGLATSAGMNLRLDDGLRLPERLERFGCRVGRLGRLSLGDGRAEAA